LLHHSGCGFLGFYLAGRALPVLLVLAVRLPFRFPERVGALLNPPLPFFIHP
jgi:hypothetical protein